MKRRADSTTLEDKITVDFEEAEQALQALVSDVSTLKSELDSIGNTSGVSNLVNQAESATTAFQKLEIVVSTISNSTLVKTTKNLLGIGSFLMVAKKAVSSIKEMTEASVDYTETLNLFSVSLGAGVDGLNEYYERALEFQDELADKLGVTKAESMEYQATFNSMAKSMGVNADAAYTLSENLTKLTYDLSSLYNIDTETAYSKLSSGVISGQSKSLRTLGIDVTEDTVQQTLDNLDIDVDYSSLTQAEKVVARYISVLEQATIAEGDLAKTMESPANQLRIFEAQVTSFKVNMGNLWQGFLGGILPYINAVMMVVNELLEMAAELFGFEYESVSGASVGVDDLTSSVDDATDSVKELKNQLMGFDEINNITINDSSSSGTVTSTGTGINQALLDALEDYDNLMGDVSSKADEIKEKLEDWLGITDGTYSGLESILEIVETIGVAFAAWTISSSVTGLLENLGLLNSTQAFQISFGLTLLATGIWLQYNGTEKLLDGDITIWSLLETFLGTAAGTFGIVSLLSGTAVGQMFTLGEKIKIGLGIMLALQGLEVMLDGIENDDWTEKIVGALETGAGIGLTASSYGGWKYGLKIGLAVAIGALSLELAEEAISNGFSLVSVIEEVVAAAGIGASLLIAGASASIAIPLAVTFLVGEIVMTLADEYETVEELDEALDQASIEKYGFSLDIEDIISVDTSSLDTTALDEYITALKEMKTAHEEAMQSIEDSYETKLTEIGYVKGLKDELSNLVDENGNVIEGNEDLVDVILEELNGALDGEYERIDDIIYINGEAVTSYSDIMDSIDDYIDKLEAEAEAEYYKDTYVQAIKDRQEAYDEYLDKYDDYLEALENGTQDEIDLAEQLMNEAYGYYEDYCEDADDARENLSNNLKGTVEDTDSAITEMTENLAGTVKETYEQLDEDTKTLITTLTNNVSDLSEDQIKKWKELAENDVDEYNKALSVLDEDTALLIGTLTTNVSDLSEDQIQQWKDLAEDDAEKYNEMLSELPDNIQTLISTLTGDVNNLSAEQIQAWADLAANNKEAYEEALTGLDETTSDALDACVTAINDNQIDAEKAAEAFAKAVDDEVDTIDTTDTGKHIVTGVTTGINNNKNSSSLKGAISGLVSNIVGWFQDKLGIASPSKVMAGLAEFIPLGVAEGIDNNTIEAVNSAKEMAESVTSAVADNIDTNMLQDLTEGISINPSDYKIDTNQFIDYGQISGAIATQSRVNINEDFIDKMTQAVVNGMKNASVQVEIEARTDEGTIVKKASKGFNEYVTQTGKLPFTVPV